MKKILFLHPGKSSLPEINAYKRYLTDYNFYNCVEIKDYKLEDFDLIWRFMGMDVQQSTVPVIHEYASLSIGRCAKIKDYIKNRLNVIPNMRIFLNSEIAQKYNFRDNVNYCYRDMGIDEQFLGVKNKKSFDFVYVGNMDNDRSIGRLLNKVAYEFKSSSILLIGQPTDDLYSKYKKFGNIKFTGKVLYCDVPQLASQAEYAINYIPNKYPYNLQTSTKLLEYVAMTLKVITTNYQWVSQFEQERNMRFFKVSEDLHELDMKKLQQFQFVNGNVDDLCWSNIIKKSGIEKALKSIVK